MERGRKQFSLKSAALQSTLGYRAFCLEETSHEVLTDHSMNDLRELMGWIGWGQVVRSSLKNIFQTVIKFTFQTAILLPFSNQMEGSGERSPKGFLGTDCFFNHRVET